MRARAGNSNNVYGEFPVDPIVGVGWAGAIPASISLNWSAAFHNPEIVEGTSTLTATMIVSPTNLPPLSRTTLSITPDGSDLSTFSDTVFGGEIDAFYTFRLRPFVGVFVGGAQYNSTNGFDGATFVSIDISVMIPTTEASDWNASIIGSVGTSGDLNMNISGSGTGGDLHFVGIFILKPTPSVLLTGG